MSNRRAPTLPETKSRTVHRQFFVPWDLSGTLARSIPELQPRRLLSILFFPTLAPTHRPYCLSQLRSDGEVKMNGGTHEARDYMQICGWGEMGILVLDATDYSWMFGSSEEQLSLTLGHHCIGDFTVVM